MSESVWGLGAVLALESIILVAFVLAIIVWPFEEVEIRDINIAI